MAGNYHAHSMFSYSGGDHHSQANYVNGSNEIANNYLNYGEAHSDSHSSPMFSSNYNNNNANNYNNQNSFFSNNQHQQQNANDPFWNKRGHGNYGKQQDDGFYRNDRNDHHYEHPAAVNKLSAGLNQMHIEKSDHKPESKQLSNAKQQQPAASKAMSWASIASQPAKVQPKSLRSKLATVVLSSTSTTKHVPPPMPPVAQISLDEIEPIPSPWAKPAAGPNNKKEDWNSDHSDQHHRNEANFRNKPFDSNNSQSRDYNTHPANHRQYANAGRPMENDSSRFESNRYPNNNRGFDAPQQPPPVNRPDANRFDNRPHGDQRQFDQGRFNQGANRNGLNNSYNSHGSRNENMIRDVPRDVQRDVPRDVQRDVQREPPRDGPRDAPRENLPRDGPRDGPRDAPRENLPQRDNYHPRDSNNFNAPQQNYNRNNADDDWNYEQKNSYNANQNYSHNRNNADDDWNYEQKNSYNSNQNYSHTRENSNEDWNYRSRNNYNNANYPNRENNAGYHNKYSNQRPAYQANNQYPMKNNRPGHYMHPGQRDRNQVTSPQFGGHNARQAPPQHKPIELTKEQELQQDQEANALLAKLNAENNYNPTRLELDSKNARFFIIKSYSEDDIHRSIKYSIWCSTEHGNMKLDNAFKEQMNVGGPVYLFYSVNGSGHFCGIAQMVSPVDYNASSGVWAQDKWKGQFKVKWIYVKDVPNGELRHIVLENNDFKPVTNSRDTQEVPAEQGKAVLKIIHAHKHKTSIFDDFFHYERKQYEEMLASRQPRRMMDSPPPPPPSNKPANESKYENKYESKYTGRPENSGNSAGESHNSNKGLSSSTYEPTGGSLIKKSWAEQCD